MAKHWNLDAGSVLGRYELVLRVASGGMGEVWAARLKGTRGFQKVVALKFLLPELSHNPSFEQMFLDEAALAAEIKHPNVVQVIDLGEEDDTLYQVMEWVSGASLWTVMRAAAKRGGIPLEVAARIVCQVCAGLHAAHELKDDDGNPRGLVHRDVSPQNILLNAQGLAKVADFGVAKFAGRGAAATQVGEIRGKVPYMAPEHVHGQELDRRADVFSLGILFYQLVAGVHPFLADNDQLTMTRISSPTPVTPLRSRAPHAPEELSRVVGEALEKSRDKRTKTALDLMHAIEHAVPGASMSSTNDLVASFLQGLVGAQIEAHEEELREALRSLDARSSLPPESVRASMAGPRSERAPRISAPPPPPISVRPAFLAGVPVITPAPPAPLAEAPARIAEAPASTRAPVIAEAPAPVAAAPAPAAGAAVSAAPPAFSGPARSAVESEREPARGGGPGAWVRRHARAVVAAGAIAAVVIVLKLAGGEEPAPSSPAALPPRPSPSIAPSEPPTAPPIAPPSAAPSAESSAASSPPVAGPPVAAPPATSAAAPSATASSGARAGGKATGKSGGKKPEYTPGGL